jgi:hypothetical protein
VGIEQRGEPVSWEHPDAQLFGLWCLGSRAVTDDDEVGAFRYRTG